MDTDAFLKDYAETRRFLAGRPARPAFTPDGGEVLFLRSGPRSNVQALFRFDVATGSAAQLLDADALLKGASQGLSAAERAQLERQRISARGFTQFQVSPDGARTVVGLSGKLYAVERATGAVTLLDTGAGVLDPRISPDGRFLAFVRAHDVQVLEFRTGKVRALTRGGTEATPHGLAEFAAQEEMNRFSGYWWSPDASRVAWQETSHEGMDRFATVDPLHPDAAPEVVPYPRAGKRNAQVRLFVSKLKGGKPVEVAWDRARYPYLATVKWPEGGPLCVLVQDRAQGEEVLFAVDPDTGRTAALLTERDEAWVNLDQDFPRWRKDGRGFLWMTERNGAPEVEERDARGTFLRVRIPAGAGFSKLAGWDEGADEVTFLGSVDPTQQALFRAGATGEPKRVALEGVPEQGWVNALASKDGTKLVVEHTSPATMPRWSVHRADGARVGELPSVAESPSLPVNVSFQQVGERKWWTAVLRPSHFVKGKKYPVLVDAYGGPHHRHVTRTLRDQLLSQWYAEAGFIVVKVDGRGTPGRGRAWERAIRGDFAGPVIGDQVEGLKALAAEVPEMDLARVGITGWSFGGYLAALAVLERGDVFHAAVAGAPVTDWADYDTHYTERYLGVPPEAQAAYDRSSLLPRAGKLERPLLLVHGTADDNVYFSHSLKLSDALFRAGKRHDVLPLGNFTHMVPDPLVTQRLYGRVRDCFREHLR
jgi:dipeptidyl-peptidase-4